MKQTIKRTAGSTRMVALGVCGVVVAGSAIAGPPNADQISERAKVMVHIDIDAMNDSMIGDLLLSQIEADSNNFEELRAIFPGFTLRAQGGLHGLTAYAGGLTNDGPKDLVLLIRGDSNLKDWNQNLGEMLAEHGGETIDLNGYSTLLVPMGDETGYLTLLNNGDDDYTWVFGQSVVSLTEGLGVLAGEKESVQGEVRERIERRQKDGTIAMFGTARLEIFEEMEQASAFLHLANQVWGKVGENEGRAFAEVTIHTDAEEKANQLVTVYNGAVAFGSVLASSNEDLAEAMAMVQAFDVWAKDGYFTIAFNYDAQELIEFIEEQNAKVQFGHDDDWGDDDDEDWDDDDI